MHTRTKDFLKNILIVATMCLSQTSKLLICMCSVIQILYLSIITREIRKKNTINNFHYGHLIFLKG